MNGGVAQLRKELDGLSDTLRAFEAPVVDELPGLRLMRHVLDDRRRQVDGKLRALERPGLQVRVDGDALPDDGLPVALASAVLGRLQDAVHALGAELSAGWKIRPGEDVVRAETAMLLAGWDAGPPAELTLRFARRPDDQLIDAEAGTALLDRVLDALVDGFDGGAHPGELRPLAELVVAHAIVLDLTASTAEWEREVRLDRVGAQRMLAREGFPPS